MVGDVGESRTSRSNVELFVGGAVGGKVIFVLALPPTRLRRRGRYAPVRASPGRGVRRRGGRPGGAARQDGVQVQGGRGRGGGAAQAAGGEAHEEAVSPGLKSNCRVKAQAHGSCRRTPLRGFAKGLVVID